SATCRRARRRAKPTCRTKPRLVRRTNTRGRDPPDLQRAEKLVRMTFLSFKEIGQEVGISDHSNFSRNFKKRFGISHFVGRNRLPVNNVLFFPARSAGANS